MDRAVERALIVQRLNYHLMEKLHQMEAKRGSLLYGSDVNQVFQLQKGTLKHWGAPAGKAPLEKYLDRVEGELARAGCIKGLSRDTDITAVRDWHAFDLRVQKAIEAKLVDLRCRRGGSLMDEVEEVERMGLVAP